MLSALLLGLALGLRHAFDPDHLVAVSAIASQERRPWRASLIGVSWATGHSATVFGVGCGVVALRFAIPESFSRGAELTVGLVLIALGVANLLRAAPVREPAPASERAALARSGLLGALHGLAGSAPLALIAMAAMPTPSASLLCLVAVGAGTIAGMVGFSLVLAAPLAWIGGRAGARRALTAATGLASLLVGAGLVVNLVYAPGLRLLA